MASKYFQVIAFGAIAIALAAQGRLARATLIVYDSFNQTAGNSLGGTTPTTPNPNTSGVNQTWQAQGGTTDNQFSSPGLSFPAAYSNAPPVAGNAVTLTGNTSLPNNSAGNADRIAINSSGSSFGSTGDLSTAYYSLLLNVSSDLTGIAPNTFTTQSSLGYGYNYGLLAAFSDSSSATGGLGTQISGIYLRAGSTAGTIDIGIGGNRGGISWSSDLAGNTTYFLAADFIAGSPGDTSSLWIDPALGQSSAPATLLTEDGSQSGGFGDNLVSAFVLTSNSGLPTDGIAVDEVRVGTTWQDVTPAGAVPEPSSLALLAMAAMGLMMVNLRRSRS